MDPIKILEAHIPSLTDEDEEEMTKQWVDIDEPNFPALRTCACGEKIDGFYEYVDHLKKVLS